VTAPGAVLAQGNTKTRQTSLDYQDTLQQRLESGARNAPSCAAGVRRRLPRMTVPESVGHDWGRVPASPSYVMK
jgi:hypothetical protein